MKITTISLVLILITSTNICSQAIALKYGTQTLETKAIRQMRNLFRVSEKNELFATTVFTTIDTTIQNTDFKKFNINNKIENYLNNLVSVYYEIFVYDKELNHIYVVNRIYSGRGRYKKEYYLGTDRDYTICSFLSNKQYDCVYIIQTYGLQLYDIPVLLCFKNGLIDLAYLKDEQWYSTPVCGSDDFSFLQPLLDERLKELEIVKERIRKEKQE